MAGTVAAGARRAGDLRHQRLVAHLDVLVAGADPVTRSTVAAIRSVAARHFPWDVYTECECEPGHRDENEPGVVDVAEVGLVRRRDPVGQEPA